MQQFDAVPADEQLLRQGRYRYFENGILRPVDEPWQWYRNAAGDELIRSSRRVAPDIDIVTRALLRGGELRELWIRWTELARDVCVEARYQGCGKCHWQRYINDRKQDSGHWPAKALLFPLMRIYTGLLFRNMSAAGGVTTVVVPDIRAGIDADKLLLPRLSQRQIEPVDLRCEAAPPACAWQAYRYRGGEYDDALFWLDDEYLLRHYRWRAAPDSLWEVALVEEQRFD